VIVSRWNPDPRSGSGRLCVGTVPRSAHCATLTHWIIYWLPKARIKEALSEENLFRLRRNSAPTSGAICTEEMTLLPQQNCCPANQKCCGDNMNCYNNNMNFYNNNMHCYNNYSCRHNKSICRHTNSGLLRFCYQTFLLRQQNHFLRVFYQQTFCLVSQ